MSVNRIDFAVLGSTPLARLVAGLLASIHGKTVVSIGDSQGAFRLPNGIDLSVAPITRPESWSMLDHALPETLKLLARVAGKGCWSRIDPILFAETAAGRMALAHMRNSAAGFGHAIEPLAPGQLGPNRDGIVMRDAVLLQRTQLEPALDHWLDKLKVRRLPQAGTDITLRRDGSAIIDLQGQPVTADSVVLIDDAALLQHLAPNVLASVFVSSPACAILTDPMSGLAAPALLQVDAGLSLFQRNTGGVVAIAHGTIEACTPRLAALLGAHGKLHRAGQSRFDRLASHDGAPVLGRINNAGPVVIGDLGPSGAFLAPALARWLSGAALEEEAAYFAARAPGRALSPSQVADYAGGIEARA
ncbi:hypothetical protein VW29_01270 [Devosia limi DSM 17137]|uniref:FAD dependent oxidoreductase n=1 Tax=Devosia limi DSM 17137 TaxID=1121477 RepID=A0A0F5LW88_9HYPH|nr:hypothetical protein [Devosia limi]KKB86625.1 hypothetical protein VW29_01270 [Devosia limi DSM 17137]SHE38792.1 hypothetical protein SAMN02745223_00247 [Devosia limi DSM 17137]